MTFCNMKFPEKLWSMVNDCKTGAITWGIDGKTIFIDYSKFENEFLGKDSAVFKTKNVVSFIRQLNLYGFRKCSRFNDIHEFKSPYFVRGRKDLLRFMRRKLGYTLDIVPAVDEQENKENMSDEERNQSPEKEDIPSGSCAVPGPSRPVGLPFSNIQDLNSLSCGWWGNSYFPMNSIYSMNNVQPRVEDNSQFKIKEEKDDTTTQRERKQVNPYWDNLDMFNNIIFVPVPAQYGMYPGFYNENFPFPYAVMPHDDKKISSTCVE